MPTPAPRKRKPQARAQATRGQILSAAKELFSRNGFEATTVQDVASAASVAVGTVYHHFPDKRAILLSLIDAWGERMLAQRRREFAFQTFFGDDPRRAIHGWLRGSYERLRKEPSLYLVILPAVFFLFRMR